MSYLRFDNPETTEDFVALVPASTPLPWSIGPDESDFVIVDANGHAVCDCHYYFKDGRDTQRLLAAIVLAVNTCAGFKASVAK